MSKVERLGFVLHYYLYTDILQTKLVNGYGKITQPIADSFGRNMIGCSNGPDRQSHTVNCDPP